MQHADVAASPFAASPLAMARVWGLHLLCLAVPLVTLAFVATGPHPWYAALPWLGVIAVLERLDRWSPPARHKPIDAIPAWPFDAVLLLLVALQLVNIALAARLVAAAGLFSADALVAAILVGANSGYSAIVVAHELIHRRSRVMQLLGRLLLVTVCYEHFFTEHVRGHHARVGTDEDPATARFGETFREFWRRTVPAQLASAWRLEARRLGDEGMRWYDPRILKSAVLHGIVAQLALAGAIFAFFGPAALVVFLAQAFVAIRLLEVVNYFEHYGLRRVGKKVRPVDSWDSDSWLTLFALVGLSRHADHHAYAARPYQALRTWDESPKLPRGYIAMVFLVMLDNAGAQRLLHEELRARRLGPFA